MIFLRKEFSVDSDRIPGVISTGLRSRIPATGRVFGMHATIPLGDRSHCSGIHTRKNGLVVHATLFVETNSPID